MQQIVGITELLDLKEKERKMWLPHVENIRQSCSYQVAGFVCVGDFSFVAGCGLALGYITLACIPSLLNATYKNKVFVRNINSSHYQVAKCEIIV